MLKNDNEKIYSVKELAASGILRISENTIRREMDRGILHFYKFGGQIFIGEHHIREYKQRCEHRSEI